ncbi:MAG: thermonuclease family protein [Candidatus Omnitrophica bacterium]|nr:thermonuclease family protein [Candidatus Omnitrophota bacterium]
MRRRIRYVVSIAALGVTFLVINFSKQINLTHQPYDKSQHQYTVRYAIDGDTVELSNGDRVRYIGIDTPEIRKREGSEWIYKPMPYAEEAKEFNKMLVEGKSVRLEYDVQKKDKYSRDLAYVYIDDKMANMEMVKQGFAMIYTYPPNVRYAQRFIEAQKDARDNKKGLWSGLDESKISTSQAKNNIGMVRIIESEVIDTHLTEKLLILKFKDNFKAVIYKNNIPLSMKDMARSPNKYFKGKTVKVYGIIKKYKGYPEIVLHDMSQLEIVAQ